MSCNCSKNGRPDLRSVALTSEDRGVVELQGHVEVPEFLVSSDFAHT